MVCFPSVNLKLSVYGITSNDRNRIIKQSLFRTSFENCYGDITFLSMNGTFGIERGMPKHNRCAVDTVFVSPTQGCAKAFGLGQPLGWTTKSRCDFGRYFILNNLQAACIRSPHRSLLARPSEIR